MVLRISVSDPTAQCRLSLKFGCEPEHEAAALLKLAAMLNVAVVGISFHVGSGCRDPTAYRNAITHARRLFNVGKELGHDMYVLDIGGGFPGVNTSEMSLEKVASIVNPAIEEHFPRDSGVQIIGEPGRFYAAAAFTICVNVIAKHTVSADKISGQASDANKPGYMYYVNDGIYGSFNCIMFDHTHPKARPIKQEAPESWCNIWGPTCDSIDLIEPGTRLPEMQIGDWILFENHGAYTMCAASTFNGFQKPEVHYIITPSDWAVLSVCLKQAHHRAFLDQISLGFKRQDSGVSDSDSGTGSSVATTDAMLDELNSLCGSRSGSATWARAKVSVLN
jgi:ornithine decarboxylase